MGRSLTHKILAAHLVDGHLTPGSEIAIRIDQTLTQDATGTMAYLQFEAMGVPRIRNELAVSYVDHNTLQTGPESADDQRFLQSFAARYGIHFSRPGNGICHQVHLERFSAPGKTLLGSDSHTPTAGGAGMLAIGAGGLDVAVAMAGGAFYLTMPRVVGVHLTGHLRLWLSAKDVVLELLRRLSVTGGVARVFEYFGAGVADFSVPERATIANMGAELGATTSLFPSDQETRRHLRAQGRERVWAPLAADPVPDYDEEIEIKLDELEPLIALPHSPDNVVKVREVAGTSVQQVCIGSCTNSSYRDLMIVAQALEGRTVHPDVSLVIVAGSRRCDRDLPGGGRTGPRVCLRALHRHGSGAWLGRGLAALVQPQLHRPIRDAGRQGVPRESGGLRRQRAGRRHQRSSRSWLDLPLRRTERRALRRSRWNARAAGGRPDGGRGRARPEHRAAPTLRSPLH